MFHIIQLTPPGRGAIATLRVEGDGAIEAVDAEFRPRGGPPLAERLAGALAYGNFGPPPSEEVVLCRDGDRAVWMHCHGGVAVVAMIRNRLETHGGLSIDWRTWVDRAGPDAIAAAARQALAEARTERAASILLDQYQGALGKAIAGIHSALAAECRDLAIAQIDALLAHAAVGRHLTRPWQVVLAGFPNVGKSSLINALVGYDRAIVHPVAGTTRDLVSAATAMDGWPVELCDTAGLRSGGENIEQIGVGLAREKIAAADLILWVVDRSRDNAAQSPSIGLEEALVPSFASRTLLVENKSDLPAGAGHGAGVAVSAARGDGIGELLEVISRRLVPNPPPPGAAVPFTEEQIEMLRVLRKRGLASAG